MSKTLTLELSDELYATLQQQASAAGLSIEEWLLTSAQTRSLPDHPSQNETQFQEQRQQLLQYAGVLSLKRSADSDFLMTIAGLGSSDQQDIAERDEEILRDEIHPIYGWNLKSDQSA
jgi:hypothetical protein